MKRERQGTVLDCVVNKGLFQEVTFEQRSEGSEEGATGLCGRCLTERGNGKCTPLMKAHV